MTSNINPTIPVFGIPTTESVRSNFTIAASEISALQAVGGGPGGGSGTVNAGTTGQIAQYLANGTAVSGATVSGDATIAYAGALTLASVNANVGTYNNLTVNAKGLVTAGNNVPYLINNQPITLTSDVTGGPSATSIVTTVVGLRSRAISTAVPTTNQVLQWSGSAWTPATVGGVTSVTAGTGITMTPGSPITASGTIALTVPVAISSGGTGGTTADTALDSLFRQSGNAQGLLVRASSGVYSTLLGLPLITQYGGTGISSTSAGYFVIGGGVGNPFSSVAPPIPVSMGGTQATTAPGALTSLGAAPLTSPAFAGTPTAPTAVAGTSTTQIATTQFVMDAAGAGGGGTITGVTAGVGLTGGGLSGNVTLDLVSPVPIANGGTNATTAAAARTSLGIGNVGTQSAPLQTVYGGTGLAQPAQYNLLIGGGTGSPLIVLPPGSVGSVLQSTGTASNPAFSADLLLNSVVIGVPPGGSLGSGSLSIGSPGLIKVSANASAAQPSGFPNGAIQVVSVDGSPAGVIVDGFPNPGVGSIGAMLRLRRGNSSGATPGALTSGDVLGAVQWWGHDGTDWQTSANIAALATEDYVAGVRHGTGWRLQTTANGSLTLIPRLQVGGLGGIFLPSSTGTPPTGGTGGDMGPGTLNSATGLYINGVAVGTASGGISQLTAGAGITLTPNPIVATGTVALTTPALPLAGGAITGSAPGSLVLGSPSDGSLGAGSLNMAGRLKVSANISAGQPPTFSTDAVQIVGVDGSAGALDIDGFVPATVNTNRGADIRLRRADGTAAAPLALSNGDIIGSVQWWGWAGSSYVASANIASLVTEPSGFTATNWGSSFRIQTAANGTAVIAPRIQILGLGGVVIGSPAGGTAGDMGPNSLNVQNLYVNGSVVGVGGGNVNAGATLTSNQLVIGQGSTAVATLGSLGAANQVLHGSAAAPTWGSVSLTTDVSGNLPVTNLNSGTNAGAATFWCGDSTWKAPPAGGGGVTSITAGTGITMTPGSPIIATGTISLTTPALPLAGGAITGSTPGSLVIGSPPDGSLGSSTLNIGTPGLIKVNANASAAQPSGFPNGAIQVVSIDGGSAGLILDSYPAAGGGGGGSMFRLRRGSSPGSAPTALLNNDVIGAVQWWGHDGSGFQSSAAIGVFATETYVSGVSHGTGMRFQTTANSSLTLVPRLQILGLGGVIVGSPTGGDMGPNTLNVQILYVNGAVVGTGGGNVNAGATLALNQLVIGQGSSSIGTLGSLGSATTVLHGGTAAPTFGAVVLTTDVSGTLPVANGGTGSGTAGGALTNLGAAPLNNAGLTGIPTAPTATTGTNTTQLATTAFVLGNGAGAGGRTAAWLAGANPNGAAIMVADRAMTIGTITVVVDVTDSGGGTLSVVKAASGSAIPGQTAIHSGVFALNATAGTPTSRAPTVTTLAAGDRLGIITTGTWTTSVGSVHVAVT